MAKKLLIRDLTLRDGQQSQLATRMNQAQIDRVLPFYKDAGFYAMEVWGGAVPDSIMRFLNENPWDRLESIKKAVGDSSKLTALSRGRNLFGYNPYPNEVIEGFNKNAIESGIDIMRVFDALNDINNMKFTIEVVKKYKGLADCALSFTVDPKITQKDRLYALLKGKKLPGKIFTADYFMNKAKELEALGADMITVKDMAGLIDPWMASELYSRMKKELSIPVDHHSHCTPGYGVASAVIALIKGVDIVDTVIGNFAGGPAAPAYEIIEIFARKMGFETGVNAKAVAMINRELHGIRQELSQFDSNKRFPREFNVDEDKLPPEIDAAFDESIELAQKGKIEELIAKTYVIDKYFNYPEPDELVKHAQIPGGMYTNMLSQLKQANMEDKLDDVLRTVPIVRLSSGCPPLVTPTSQIVGVQAVSYVLDVASGKEPYTTLSQQFVQLVKGGYGKTPIAVTPEFRKKITGDPTEVPYDTSQHQKQENPEMPEYGEGVKLAMNEKEELLLELFPAVAKGFLKGLREKELLEKIEMEHKKALEELAEYYAFLDGGVEGDYLTAEEPGN